jgi:hypothetical protein
MRAFDPPMIQPQGRGVSAPPVAPRGVRVLCLLLLIAIAGWLARVGVEHIYWQHPDFEYFYKAGAWLWSHGTLDRGYDVVGGQVSQRGMLDWYWPFVHRLMTLPALLPYRAAGYLWLALNLVAMLATIRLIGRHLTGLPPGDWPVTQLIPVVILLPYWLWEFRLNQINNLTLLLMVGSYVCWERGRWAVSGFWLGLAALLKLAPGLLIAWFLLKRQYRTVAVAAFTVVLAGPAADLIALGPSRTVDSYRTWVDRSVTVGSHRGLILAQLETDWRNQGLGAVLSRWLHPTNYNTHFDNDPRVQASYADYPRRTLNLVSLPLTTVADTVAVILGGMLIGLFWLTRRPARRLTLWQLRFEWALCLLVMLGLMPVMRRYHLIWALPALSVLGAGVHYGGLASRWSKLALACIGLMVVAEVTLLFKPLEAAGTVLASVGVLALPLVVMLVRLGRQPAALPGPAYASPPRATPAESAATQSDPMSLSATAHG